MANLWKRLTATYTKAGVRALGTLNPRLSKWWTQSTNQYNLEYKSRAAYRSVFEYVARREAINFIAQEIRDLYPSIEKKMHDKMLQSVRLQQAEKQKFLLEHSDVVNKGLGVLEIKDAGWNVNAVDKYGNQVLDALILSYEGEDTVKVTREVYSGISGAPSVKTFNTKTVFVIDLAPEVALSSSKNVVTTNVQGRDYSRKELVAGGDLKFSISGNLVYDEPDIYPDNDVKKFIQIMQHNGIINVSHMLFKQLGVKSVIITDWSLDKQVFKNMQPYSFSCVAIEPDEEVRVAADTITQINHAIRESDLDAWYSLLLDMRGVAETAETMLNDSLASLLDLIPSTRI